MRAGRGGVRHVPEPKIEAAGPLKIGLKLRGRSKKKFGKFSVPDLKTPEFLQLYIIEQKKR